MKRNDKIYFSKCGSHWTTAYFLDNLGTVASFETCRVKIDGQEWIVKRNEIHSEDEHILWLKEQFKTLNHALITAHNESEKPNKAKLARDLNMGYGKVLRLLKKAKEFGLVKAVSTD